MAVIRLKRLAGLKHSIEGFRNNLSDFYLSTLVKKDAVSRARIYRYTGKIIRLQISCHFTTKPNTCKQGCWGESFPKLGALQGRQFYQKGRVWGGVGAWAARAGPVPVHSQLPASGDPAPPPGEAHSFPEERAAQGSATASMEMQDNRARVPEQQTPAVGSAHLGPGGRSATSLLMASPYFWK